MIRFDYLCSALISDHSLFWHFALHINGIHCVILAASAAAGWKLSQWWSHVSDNRCLRISGNTDALRRRALLLMWNAVSMTGERSAYTTILVRFLVVLHSSLCVSVCLYSVFASLICRCFCWLRCQNYPCCLLLWIVLYRQLFNPYNFKSNQIF